MLNDYLSRIHKTLNFIDDHLDETITLEKIAEVGHYSPFHMHRLFKAVTGEPLNAYITRKRVEKIALILIRKPETNIADLGFQYGFNSASSLTRTFKKYYGISPSQFKKNVPNEFSKISQVNSKNGQVEVLFEEYVCSIHQHLKFIEMNATVEIKSIAEMHLACTTNIGTANMDHHFDAILKWAIPKGLLEKESTKVIRIYHDSFKVTAPEKIRMSACISVENEIEIKGDVMLKIIQSCKCIVGHFKITPQEFGAAWDSLIVWMTEKGYEKSNQDPFEIYHNDYRTNPEGKCIVDLCIPIG